MIFEARNELIKAGYLFSDRSPFEIKNINQAYMHGGSEYCCQLSNGEKLWIELPVDQFQEDGFSQVKNRLKIYLEEQFL